MPLSSENDLAHKLIGIAIEIHKNLGPGLNPEIYKQCLVYEFEELGYGVAENASISVQYKGKTFEDALKCDFVINDQVGLMLDPSDSIQEYKVFNMIRFLKETQLKLGLVINFNASLMKNGIRRVTNHKLLESISSTME